MVPQYSTAGRYQLSTTILDDEGNARTLTSDDLAAAGWPSFVDITDSDPDTTAPTVTSVTVTPSSVDVSAAPADVTIELGIDDDRSGVTRVFLFLSSAAPSTGTGGAVSPVMTLVSGTATSGVWRGTTTIPRYSREGRWTFTIFAVDRVSNVRSTARTTTTQTTGFDVVSDPEDLAGPQFVTASITPAR